MTSIAAGHIETRGSFGPVIWRYDTHVYLYSAIPRNCIIAEVSQFCPCVSVRSRNGYGVIEKSAVQIHFGSTQPLAGLSIG